ncbi:MAG TPA: hypothetical protein V6D27_02790, partial [Vampirovibrionales bacterium]
ASDKLHNSRSILQDYRAIGETVWDRFKGGKTGTLWYYRALVEAFRLTAVNPNLFAELERTVTAIEQLTSSLDQSSNQG